ncbi:hypothetical protein Tco_1185827 [Tanacetum coccineum]
MTTFYEKHILMRTNVTMDMIMVRSGKQDNSSCNAPPLCSGGRHYPLSDALLQKELKSMFEKQAGVESVGLILNGIISDFAGSVRNYYMHNMRKTIGELHDLLIEYEKGLPKKAATPQVMAIQDGRIHKSN